MATFTRRSFDTENLLHTQAFSHTGARNCSPKTRSRPTARKRRFWSTFYKDFWKQNWEICWQVTIATLMQPLQFDLQGPAAKDSSITHAAAAPSNLDAAITVRSAETELKNTKELHATASEIAAPKPDLGAKAKKKIDFEALLKGISQGKSQAPKLRKPADKSLLQPWCSHPNTV